MPRRRDRVRRLAAALLDDAGAWRGATLGRCRLAPLPGGRVLVCREARGLPHLEVAPGNVVWWDRRFAVRVDACGPGARIGALGAAGWREIAARMPQLRETPVPVAARAVLPAVWDRWQGQWGVCAVPNLGYNRSDGPGTGASARFRPARPLSGRGFCLALAPPRTI
ncbi:MAG: hypothetical protein H6907_08125 [Hyphomicrobiales bacterium]|nr:hypothetical protein [Hyphomicrobiales bacterium]